MDYKKATVTETSDIRSAISAIDLSGLQIALVVDESLHLKGTVTDGDIRRGILRGIPTSESVLKVMNPTPIVGTPEMSRDELALIMATKKILQIPIVDASGKLVGIHVQGFLGNSDPKENWVVIMAGGLGKRLGQLTAQVPKPMLAVQNRPLLETIVENVRDYGFNQIFISVNYKRELIQAHFGDGHQHGVQIRYLEESQPLGTGGSLSLLPEDCYRPIVVMNADLVTNLNFDSLLDFHQRTGAQATVCVRDYDLEVPYGVVRFDQQRITGIEEKPKVRFFVNAGIYVLNPEVLKKIPADTRMDMPELLDKLIRDEFAVSAFPIRESWIDIGLVEDFERANRG